MGVRRRVIISVVERETTQTADLGPKDRAKWRRLWERLDSQEVGLEAAIF